MRGVEISSSMPGHYATEFYPTQEDYLRWFSQIKEMGANTLKPQRLMDDEFYNALYTYNEEHEKPLYLLQGISVSDAANYGYGSGYDADYMGQLLEDGKAAVDIIHGKKTIGLGRLSGTGKYLKDISEYTIGIVVGNDWNPDAVAYTDHQAIHENARYEGTYLSSKTQASPFEVMLTEVMDKIIKYETEKYHEQRPVGFINSPETDFLEYDENYAEQLRKYVRIDAEHLAAKETMKAGIFAAYRLFDYCDRFSDYLSEEQIRELGDKLAGLDEDSSYGGYLQLVSRYHTMPALLTEYGFSTARGATRMGSAPNDEVMQGEKLMRVYGDAMTYGWSGVCISAWQDIWEQKTWNTAFAVNLNRRNLWHDVQSDGQNYGLMAYVPGEKEKICVIDGKTEEWLKEDEAITSGDTSVSLRYDEEALYLMVSGEEISPENRFYIPIDICDEVGNKSCAAPELTFDGNVDFILCVDGTENTRLLVQERYLAMRERFEHEITGKDPFAVFPDKESAVFVPVQMALENPTLLADFRNIAPEERRRKTAFGIWNTGYLTWGTEDKDSKDHTSLADFYFGSQCVEIRIPWQMLNIADPTLMSVHRDYYENYGVEFKNVKSVGLGFAADSNREDCVELQQVRLKKLDRQLKVHERLKDSYYIVRNVWKEENADAVPAG